jgi:hypothetical protein
MKSFSLYYHQEVIGSLLQNLLLLLLLLCLSLNNSLNSIRSKQWFHNSQHLLLLQRISLNNR